MTEPRFARLVQLRDWLRGLGCCQLCAIEMAWAQMWRESVEPTYWLTRPPGCPRQSKPDCFAVARENWTSAPARTP
jgi:hypothetical protein